MISVIASKSGLKQLLKSHPDLHVSVGTVDDSVNADGVVLPGLGDAGDRLFDTNEVLDAEEALLHPSKRKRSSSM